MGGRLWGKGCILNQPAFQKQQPRSECRGKHGSEEAGGWSRGLQKHPDSGSAPGPRPKGLEQLREQYPDAQGKMGLEVSSPKLCSACWDLCRLRQAPPLSRPGFSPSLQWHCRSLLKPLRGLPGEQSVFNLERICLPGVI